MVLSDKEILGIQDGATSFITPFDESRLRAASYDVSLDGEITALLERADVLDLSNQDAVDLIYSTKRGLEEFILKPGQYCLAALNEIITLPDNIVARVMPRTRFTRLGLLVAPQFCNPSYSGRLQLGSHSLFSLLGHIDRRRYGSPPAERGRRLHAYPIELLPPHIYEP